MDSVLAVSKLGKYAAHVYHLEWLGIRSAVTALDGLKDPISYEMGISKTQLGSIVEKTERAKVRCVDALARAWNPNIYMLIAE